LAGAYGPDIAAGSVLEASEVVDSHTGERFATSSSGERRVLVTTSSIASMHEKTRLLAAYGAAMVDMEAATVARLARARGLGFRAVKGISDAHDFELVSLGMFAGRHGHFRTGAFALHTAIRPHKWAKTMQLGRDSNRALTELTRLLSLDLKGQ
jgi:adenosylhomocysteine nucleosidase